MPRAWSPKRERQYEHIKESLEDEGRPDPRPNVRENEPILGTLVRDFNFKQKPRPALILDPHPPTDLH